MMTYQPRRRAARQRGRRPARAGVLRGWPLLALLAGACDLPSGLPKWDTQWLIPVKSSTLAVGQLLPPSVSIAPDGSAFQVTVLPVAMVRTLAQLCPAYAALSGQTVPKPACTSTVTDTLKLPSDVSQATLASGSVAVTITNGFSFDPLRPGASARGTIVLTLTSGGATIGTLTLDGATDALPAGSTITRTVALTGVVAGRIAVGLTITSPAGDPVRIDGSQQFTVTATPQGLRLADVTVPVNQKMVAIQPVDLSVEKVDQSLVNDVKAGTLVLGIVNPFAVTGTMTVTITGPGVAITKQIPLAAGTTTQRVPFTQQEIQSILGKAGVLFNAGGPVNATQPVKLTPTQAAQVTAQLELILGPQEG